MWDFIRKVLQEEADQIAIDPEYQELLFWLICIYMDEHRKSDASSDTESSADQAR